MINIQSLLYKEIEQNSSSIFLLKTNSTGLIGVSEINDLLGNNDNYFYKNYKTENFAEPYEPILSTIKQLCNSKNTIDSFFNNIDIYTYHREIFESYISTGVSHRLEPILNFDFNYEKSRIYETLLQTLNYFSENQPLIFILENINYAPYSTIQWIKWLLNKDSSCNFKIVLTLNNYTYYNSNYQSSFDNLVQKLELNGLLVQLSDVHDFINFDNVINYTNTLSYSEIGDNHYNFLALEEAFYWYYKAFESLKGDLNNSTLNDFCQILIKLGDTCRLMEEYDNASNYYDLLLNYSLEYGDDYLKLIAIQKTSMVNILKQKYELAENLAKQSYSLANKINDSHLLLNSYSLLFWINEKSKYRTNLTTYFFDSKFIDLAKRYNYNNILAYYLTHTFNAIGYSGVSDQNLDLYTEGLNIAKKIDNQNCILSSHLKTALVYAVKGFYNTSIKYYKKVEHLLINMNDKFRLAQTYNGMGYYLLTKEKYEESNIYYDKALENLKNNWNYDEICMTLLNKSIVYLLAEHYSLADDCFTIFLSVLNVLKLTRLRLTTLTRVYGIIGLNNYYLGNNYKAYSFMSKMKINSPNTTIITKDDDDEFFLVNLLQGLLLKAEGKLESSKNYFEKANFYLNRLEGSLKCLYPKFTLEYISVLETLGLFDEAYKLKNRCINFCMDNEYSFYLAKLTNTPQKVHFIFNKDISHLAWIKEAAKQQSTLDSMNSKVDEINFLNLFQENLSSLDDFDKVVKNSMILLENRFALDFELLLSSNDDNYELVFQTTNKDNINFHHINLYNEVKNLKTSFVYSNNNSKHNTLIDILNNFLDFKIHSLIYIPILKENEHKGCFIGLTKSSNNSFNNEITLNLEDLRILNIAIKQLFETLNRIKGQQILLQSAYTDILTGLCNRQGFYNNLTKTIFINNNKSKTITLFYIDLDNFKYYNDTFGHKIGDMVLIWYGSLLRSIIPNTNTPIRYGGDEFLLLLEDYTKAQVTEIADLIYDKLKDSKGFIDKISDLLNKPIEIPQEKLLSCSMGITINKLCDNYNIQELVDQGDETMYEAKKAGKHRYVIKSYI